MNLLEIGMMVYGDPKHTFHAYASTIILNYH